MFNVQNNLIQNMFMYNTTKMVCHTKKYISKVTFEIHDEEFQSSDYKNGFDQTSLVNLNVEIRFLV